MPSWRLFVTFLALSLSATGCHARFQKHAGTLGTVETRAMVTGGPTVRVRTPSTGVGVVDVAVSVGMGVGAGNAAGTIRSAVDSRQVAATMEKSVADAIGDGPPFAVATSTPAGGLVEIDIRDFGVDASTGTPEFRFNALVKVYRQTDGWRVYRNRVRCSSNNGGWNVGGVVGVGQSVAGLAQLAGMEDSQIRETFDQQAALCGRQITAQMRRHAGR